MREFTSLSTFAVNGKTVFSVLLPEACDRAALNELLGQSVRIDGTGYVVRGVESFAIPHLAQGAPIGLMVEPG